jgi:hypothetical protein
VKGSFAQKRSFNSSRRVSFYRFVTLDEQRACDDEAQRIRGIAIYNESDGLPSRSTSCCLDISPGHGPQKRANAKNDCAKGGSDGQNVCGLP